MASSDSLKPIAGSFAVGGGVFHAVGNPEIRQAGLAERLADGGADFAAADAVLNPKLADGFVRMREREAIGSFGVGEIGLVEIHANAGWTWPRRSSS